jgi:hypothetical protein
MGELRKDIQSGDREANSRIFCRVTKDQGLDIVEGSAPSETEEKPTSNVSVREAGDVGSPAALDNFAPTARERKRRRTFWMMVVHLDRVEPYQGVARDERS